MKKTKKFLAIILVILMVISITPITASAAASGVCGEKTTWSYDTSTCVLTISGTGEMKNYKYNNRPWETYKTKIDKVIISDGVNSIGFYAFYDIETLKSVTISGSVKTIGAYVFSRCANLIEITIPEGLTTIGDYAFADCAKLSDIILSDSVTTIGKYAFANCDNISIITLTDSVATIGEYAFYDCDALTNVVISEGVKTIGKSVFFDCINLRTITLPESLTSLGALTFSRCARLESITIPGGVGTVGMYMFQSCTGLKKVTICEGVEIIDSDAFYNCGIEILIIPKSVTKIGDDAFYRCDNIIDVYFGGSQDEWRALRVVGISYQNIHYGVVFSDTGIMLLPENGDTIPKGAKLNVSILEEKEDSIMFDITLINNETEVQPNGNVTVKIPVPADMDTNGLSVYRAEDDGTYTNMNAVYEDGYMVFTTDHFSIYVLTYEEPECLHKSTTVVNYKAPTCTETGYNGDVQCTVCGETIESLGETPATGHEDNDGDGYCDADNALLDPSVECDHNCHKGGISGFFWRIINFFNKLFKTNPVCECGVAHF